MRVEVRKYVDKWQDIKDVTMTTIGKNTGSYPTSEWKRKLLLSEHSPIREGNIKVKIYDIPYWVSTHLVRHHIGVEKYVSTQRTDRTGIERDDLPQGNLVDLEMSMSFQAVINISKKRCCMCASKETREVWRAVLDAIEEYEPELVSVCVPDCLYRGFCAEMFSCGYSKSDDFNNKLEQYSGGVKLEN